MDSGTPHAQEDTPQKPSDPLHSWPTRLALVVVAELLLYGFIQVQWISPWGSALSERTDRAVREQIRDAQGFGGQDKFAGMDASRAAEQVEKWTTIRLIAMLFLLFGGGVWAFTPPKLAVDSNHGSAEAKQPTEGEANSE